MKRPSIRMPLCKPPVDNCANFLASTVPRQRGADGGARARWAPERGAARYTARDLRREGGSFVARLFIYKYAN